MLINAWGTPDPDENNIDPFQAKLPTHELGDVVFFIIGISFEALMV